MIVVDLFVDGANGGSRGTPGGWAFVLLDPQTDAGLAISGHEHLPITTNNRMELTAVCKGLEHLGSECSLVTVYTDSAYVKNPFTYRWIYKWQANGWKSSEGADVANQDLWVPLVELVNRHRVTWQKVKGHREKSTKRTNLWNCRVDALAVAAKKSGSGVVEFVP